jgi:predicted transcriptional regulator
MMLSLLLVEIGMKILAAKLGGKAEEVAKIPGLIREYVVALNKLAVEETGQPIDWSTITEQHHFSGPDPE